MFDIGFLELIIVSIVGLLVLGPERLPGAIRTVMAYVNKIRRSFAGIRAEIERELQADEFRQDLHNQGIMEELKQVEKTMRKELGNSTGVKLGKDGYPIDQPYQASEPSAHREPSASKEPSADKEPSAQEEPSANKEPPAETDPATEQVAAAADAEQPADTEAGASDPDPVLEPPTNTEPDADKPATQP